MVTREGLSKESSRLPKEPSHHGPAKTLRRRHGSRSEDTGRYKSSQRLKSYVDFYTVGQPHHGLRIPHRDAHFLSDRDDRFSENPERLTVLLELTDYLRLRWRISHSSALVAILAVLELTERCRVG